LAPQPQLLLRLPLLWRPQPPRLFQQPLLLFQQQPPPLLHPERISDMKPIKIDCRPAKSRPTGFFQIECAGDRVQVRRHNPDGSACDALTLDFPVKQAALAVAMANLLAGARHA